MHNPSGFRFCGACGAALVLGGDTPSYPGRAADAERRQLTVLFCDLVGYSELSERLDPEDLREILRAYQTVAESAIRRFGGHVAQLLGDGLLAYFGYPRAHEDDPQRATYAALAVLDGLRDMDLPGGGNGDRPAARIGIHTGSVVAGEVGAGQTRARLALGSTPNLAARLQAMAQPSTIVVSDDTRQMIDAVFSCTDLGPQELKGISKPVRAHRVEGEISFSSRFDSALMRGLTRLVGRQAELETLGEAFTGAQRGRGGGVLISGGAGVGKSRLLHALKDTLAGVDHTWLTCQCLPYYSHSSLHPVIEGLKSALDFRLGDNSVQSLSRLEQVRSSGIPRKRAIPLLADLLSVPLGDRYAALDLTPERQKEETLATLLDILQTLASESTVVLVIEDLHWVDPSTLEFLDLLLERARESRICVLLTARADSRPDWDGPPALGQLEVEGLDAELAEAMVTELAGGKKLPGELVAHLVEKADGVPLFLEELTKTVLAGGFLREADSGYELIGALPTLAVPSTLQDSLMARLDRLPGARDVVQLGAAIGREFSFQVLAAITAEDPARLAARLDQLVEAEILSCSGRPPEAEYTFRHALLQDAAYDSLLRANRRRLHARIAQALEESFPKLARQEPEVLARHFGEAGMARQAIGCHVAAAQLALGRFANAEAMHHVRSGLELLAELAPGADRDALELALQTANGSALMAAKGYGSPELEGVFERARELCDELGNRPEMFRAVLGLWMFYTVRSRPEQAGQLARQLIEIARSAPTPDPAALMQATYCLGYSDLFSGRFEAARERLEEAMALDAEDTDFCAVSPARDDVRVHVLAALGLTLWHLGRPELALRRCQEAVELARSDGHPYGLAFGLTFEAWVQVLRARVEEADRIAGQVVKLCREKGYRFFELCGHFWHSWVQARRAMEDADSDGGAIDTMRGLIDRYRQTGADMAGTFMLAQLAESQLAAGRLDQVALTLDEGLELAAVSGEAAWRTELERLRAEQLSRDSATREDAERAFAEALDTARGQGARGLELRVANGLADHYLRHDRGHEAQEVLAAALSGFEEGFETADLRRARALASQAAARRSRVEPGGRTDA